MIIFLGVTASTENQVSEISINILPVEVDQSKTIFYETDRSVGVRHDEMEQINEVIERPVLMESSNINSVELSNQDPDFEPMLENTSRSESENEAPQSETQKRTRSTKYDVNKKKWNENINRVNREKGKSYTGKRKKNGKWEYNLLKEPRSLKAVCNCKLSRNLKCSLKCTQLTEDERLEIFKTFWQYTWPEKKLFVKNHISVNSALRKRGQNDISRRSLSNKFYLGKNRLRVCKVMFLNTLGVKEWVIKKWAKTGLETHKTTDKNEVDHSKSNVIDKRIAVLHEFFDSLPKLESHYCRASTSKLYLEPIWNSKANLYKIYKNEYCKSRNEKYVSIATFHKEFDKMRLSLYRPKKDLCDNCVAYETGNLPEEKYQDHILLKTEARNEKNMDKESQNEVFTMDLQAVLLAPKSNVSAQYYKTKLIVHNFTLFDIKRQQGYCYIWNESEGGLTSNEFSTLIINFLNSHLESYPLKEDTEIILWSDGCGYQNRNATLSNALFNFALERKVTVVQKYLLKGHTQMEVDSVHSVIEKKIRNTKINVPADYVNVCKTACQKAPYKVEYILHNFFKKYDQIKHFKSIRPGKVALVHDLKALKYSNNGVYFKLRHPEDWQALPVRLNIPNIIPISVTDLAILHKNRLKIKAEKYQHLQQLKMSLEKDYHDFYDKLPHD